MTIEFWPRRLLRKASASREPLARKRRWPRLPILAGKAHQKLSQAIICTDHELASWLDRAVKMKKVTGEPLLIDQLRQRLDDVMAPLG